MIVQSPAVRTGVKVSVDLRASCAASAPGGVTAIALWLGHDDLVTTHRSLESDLTTEEAALRRVEPPTSGLVRFKGHNRLLAFIEAL